MHGISVYHGLAFPLAAICVRTATDPVWTRDSLVLRCQPMAESNSLGTARRAMFHGETPCHHAPHWPKLLRESSLRYQYVQSHRVQPGQGPKQRYTLPSVVPIQKTTCENCRTLRLRRHPVGPFPEIDSPYGTVYIHICALQGNFLSTQDDSDIFVRTYFLAPSCPSTLASLAALPIASPALAPNATKF